MKKSILSLIVASVIFSGAANAVNDPNKYTQDQHHIMLDIMEVESHQKATNEKVDKINVDVTEANKNAAEALGKSSDLEGRVSTNEQRLEDHGNLLSSVEQQTELNATAIINTNTELNYQVERGEQAFAGLNNKIEISNDFDRRITQNSNDIQTDKKRNDAAWVVMVGGKPHLDNNGEFDGFLRPDTNTMIMGPDGSLYGYKENAGLYGRLRLTADDHETRITKNTARIDGNDERIENLQEVKADKTDLATLESKGTDAYLELSGKVDNVISGGMLAMNGVIKLGDYIKSNGGGIKAGISGKVSTVIDNSVTNLVNNEGSKLNLAVNGAKETANDFEQRISKNTTDIAAQDKIISKQGERLTNVEYTAENNRLAITKQQTETVRLDDVKADRTELAELESKGNDAYTNLNGKLTEVEGHINNAKHIAGKVKGAVDVVINNSDTIVGGVNGAINSKVENITNNITGDVLNQIGDIVIDGNSETVVNIKNDITNDVTNQLKLDAKDIALNIKKDIVEGNNEYANIINGKYTSAKNAAEVVIKNFQDQIDATNDKVDGQVDRAENAAIKANEKALDTFNFIDDKKLDKTVFDTEVARGEAAYTKVNDRIDNVVNQGNEELTNINNQFGQVNETINNGIADNTDKLIAMGRGESERLETELRHDGQAAYDDLASRIEKATSEEEISNILNQYKKDQLTKIQARVNAARPGAEQALADAKANAKKEANLYVKGKIDQAIANNTDAGKDYVQNEIDKAIEGMVPGANDLDDRIEKIENTINDGKHLAVTAKKEGTAAAIKITAKAPTLKGALGSQANAAKTYAKSVNSKADAALAMGVDNSDAIIAERDDRIRGQRDTLKAANNYTDSRFNSIQNQVDDNRKRAAAGISGVSAMTNIPQLSGNSTYSFGVGIGGFDGEQSIAAGMSGRVAENVILRSSLSTSTQGEVVWGAGVGFEW